MSVLLERTYRFAAAHLYSRPEWSEAQNRVRFGKCSIAPGHGHNYRLTLRITGEIDPKTGFLADLAELDRIVKERVLDRLDHQHLNHAIADFAPGRAVPTGENLVCWIREALHEQLPAGCQLRELRLAEDDDLAAIWTPDT